MMDYEDLIEALEDYVPIECVTLTGHGNFVRWQREMKEVITAEGLAHLVIPREDPLTSSFAIEGTIFDNPGKPPSITKSDVKDEKLFNAYATGMDIWKILNSQYEEQQKQLIKAKKLLFSHVDKSIRSSIAFESPSESWCMLEKAYGRPKPATQAHITDQIDELTLVDCKDVQDYVSHLRCLTADLKSVGGSISDSQLKMKILRDLPPRYDRFKNTIALRETWGMTVDYDQLIALLVTWKDHDDVGSDKKCTKCKKKGHIIDNCYFEHPEKAPKSWKARGPKKSISLAIALAEWAKNNPSTSVTEADVRVFLDFMSSRS